MNKSLFYRDKNTNANLRDYEGLIGNKSEYQNQSFDVHNRARSKSDYNNNFMSAGYKNNNQQNYVTNNNLNFSNCSTHPNEKDNHIYYNNNTKQ
jgi:hypothetical protein